MNSFRDVLTSKRRVLLEQIIGALLCPETSSRTDTVLIHGPASAGKTTLARLVLKDGRVKDQFSRVTYCSIVDERQDLMRWGIEETILRHHSVKTRSAGEVRSGRCLFVFDSVPEHLPAESWSSLAALFRSCGGPGSKILAISRRAEAVETPFRFHVGEFTEEEFWCHFKHHVFGSADLEKFPALVPIGRCLAKELKGDLLKASIVAALLRRNLSDRRYWEGMWARVSSGSRPPLEPWELQLFCHEAFPVQQEAVFVPAFAPMVQLYLDTMASNYASNSADVSAAASSSGGAGAASCQPFVNYTLAVAVEAIFRSLLSLPLDWTAAAVEVRTQSGNLDVTAGDGHRRYDFIWRNARLGAIFDRRKTNGLHRTSVYASKSM